MGRGHVFELMEAAKSATGLEDFGADHFRDGLERLVASAEREARLNAAGRAMFDGQAVMLLMRRLEIEDWYARHPEIEEQEIVAPLMVLGLPRTGSTALHCLLGEDPAVRVMRNWEAMMPCPPPEAATYASDPAHRHHGRTNEAARRDDAAHEADAALHRDLAHRGPDDDGL